MSELKTVNRARHVPTEEITAAMRRAVREAVVTHAKLGRSVPVASDGQVVWLSPDEILAQFESSAANA